MLATTCATTSRGQDVPQFRGVDGQGHMEGEVAPLNWDESTNITWKTPIPGDGWSSPVLAGSQVWLSTSLDAGKKLLAICVNKDTGKVEHEILLFEKDDPGSVHANNNHASPTPIYDGERLYFHFGDNGTACLLTDGSVIWKSDELKYEHGHGPGGSPVLYEDLLIINCDGTDVQYVVALDRGTGEIRWKSPRQGRMAYSTPLIIQVNGQDQLISTGGDAVVAYDPRTGKEIWRSRYDGFSLVPRPVYSKDVLVICSGYNSPVMYALRADGNGDVTDTHIMWSRTEGVPNNPSPLVIEDDLYFVSDQGVLTCVDLVSGEEKWKKRIGTKFWASPFYASGRIYLLDDQGTTTVIEPGPEFKQLAKNKLDGFTQATPVVSDGALFLRTDKNLYRIEER